MNNKNTFLQPTNQDSIFIKDLTLNVIIGITNWEKQLTKSISISVIMFTNFLISIPNKNLSCDYKNIVDLISSFCINKTFINLMTIVLEIEKIIIEHYGQHINTLQLEVKQLFPIKNVKEIGATIARTYSKS